ncbi:hypothetical protein ABNK63_13565 [Rhodanobacter sp. IGA1.0]|uniref:Uncharacterized protein n=1 Tax=Rhodanobacter sp. IGA1.0 TaxID=3158582 RepID=A0AAU7QJ16_9GAMM
MTRLSWPDIFTSAQELNFAELLSYWPRTVSGRLQPIGASAFGELYFQRPSGGVERLDVLEGGVHAVAASQNEFQANMNSSQWQESNLLTEGVALLHERGLKRAPGQFFAFAPHPSFAGKIDWSRVVPLDAKIWHSICAQALEPAA